MATKHHRGFALSGLVSAIVVLGAAVVPACTESPDDGTKTASGQGPDASAPHHVDPSTASRPRLDERSPNYGPSDTSRSRIQQNPTSQVSHAESSLPFATAPNVEVEESEVEHKPLKVPRTFLPLRGPTADPIAQTEAPVASMPATLLNFAGQAGSALGSYPPDTNGVVGRNHYVQAVNTNIAIWSKTGAVVQASKAFSSLWAGYTGTNAGNGCRTRNDGDPVVVYDQLADRWFLTQFSLPNTGTVSGPSFQCVAVSKTADPTGAYWLYDFKYDYSINDYGKFGIWPDGYYGTFNIFDSNPDPAIQFDFKGATFCAYDRVKMLAGQAAAQQCFLQAFPAVTACPTDGGTPPVEPFQVGGALPISLDGPIAPPLGAPGYFMQFDYSQCGPVYNQVDLWAAKLDWTTPANSRLTGPTVVQVADFTPTCYSAAGAECVPERNNATLAGLDDRLMFRFTYRNFGTHESLLVNHSVVAGTTGGIRWYELRLPGGTPTLFQQGTYAPSDTNWRWMASLAQDMAQDMALGYSISSTTRSPSIAWTGRTVGDPAGTMGQAEAVVDTGAGNQTGGRWGDYSNMTVDPVDDCTFWYTQELYTSNGTSNWKTFIATTKFPSCGANNFSLVIAPATRTVAQGAQVTYTVTTASTQGATESIVLNIQDLPTGVTAAFVPATVTTGGTSTLTLTASATAPPVASPGRTFTVIGKAPSAVHAATAQVIVTGVACVPLTTCPAGKNCGTIPDTCGGTVSCGPACTAPQTCGGGGTANVCGCTAATTCGGGQNCGTIPNGCGGTVNCGTCTAPQTCTANVCGGGGVDAGVDAGCTPITACGAGQNCGTIPNGCGGTVNCGTCTAPQTCTANVCGGGVDAGVDAGCTPITTCGAGQNCGTIPDTCGGSVNCGTCTSTQTCSANQCVDNAADSGAGSDSGTPGDGGARDSGVKRDSGSTSGDGSTDGSSEAGDGGGGGNDSGCGCRTAQPRSSESTMALFGLGGLALVGAGRLRRRARK